MFPEVSMQAMTIQQERRSTSYLTAEAGSSQSIEDLFPEIVSTRVSVEKSDHKEEYYAEAEETVSSPESEPDWRSYPLVLYDQKEGSSLTHSYSFAAKLMKIMFILHSIRYVPLPYWFLLLKFGSQIFQWEFVIPRISWEESSPSRVQCYPWHIIRRNFFLDYRLSSVPWELGLATYQQKISCLLKQLLDLNTEISKMEWERAKVWSKLNCLTLDYHI